MTLRDALATALLHADRRTGPTATADAILSDPTFRLALTEAIAEALTLEWYSAPDGVDRREAEAQAASVVARMLP